MAVAKSLPEANGEGEQTVSTASVSGSLSTVERTAAHWAGVMFAGNASHTFFSFWPALGFYHHGLLVAGAIGLVLCYPALPARVARLERRPAGAALSLAVFLVAYAFAMTSHYSPFIYFRF